MSLQEENARLRNENGNLKAENEAMRRNHRAFLVRERIYKELITRKYEEASYQALS